LPGLLHFARVAFREAGGKCARADEHNVSMGVRPGFHNPEVVGRKISIALIPTNPLLYFGDDRPWQASIVSGQQPQLTGSPRLFLHEM
jgi:hypothetical protein